MISYVTAILWKRNHLSPPPLAHLRAPRYILTSKLMILSFFKQNLCLNSDVCFPSLFITASTVIVIGWSRSSLCLFSFSSFLFDGDFGHFPDFDISSVNFLMLTSEFENCRLRNSIDCLSGNTGSPVNLMVPPLPSVANRSNSLASECT